MTTELIETEVDFLLLKVDRYGALQFVPFQRSRSAGDPTKDFPSDWPFVLGVGVVAYTVNNAFIPVSG